MTTFVAKQSYGDTSVARPGIASLGTDQSAGAIIAWRGNQNSENLSIAPIELNLSEEPKSVVKDGSASAPSVAYFNNSWRVAWTGTNPGHSLNVARAEFDFNAHRFSIADKVVLGDSSDVGCVIAAGDALYLAWSGRDGGHTINVARSTDGKTFPIKKIWSGHSSTLAPSIAFNEGRLFVAYTRADGHLIMCEVDNPTNPEPTFVKDLGETSGLEPAIAGFGHHVAVAWTGLDGGRHLNVGEYDPSPAPSFFKDTYEDSSIAGPSLAKRRITQDPHSNVPDQDQLLIGWTGTDGAGHLSVALVKEQNAV